MVKNDPDKCCYCGACVGVCPTLALELDDTRLAYFKEKCINCNSCVLVCPVGAMIADKAGTGAKAGSGAKGAKGK